MSATKLKQFDLWGKPIEEAKPSTTIQSLAFEGSRVRARAPRLADSVPLRTLSNLRKRSSLRVAN